MSIRDYKITDAQIAEKGVIASPDTLTGTADENKRVFDRLVRECVAPQFNEIVETFADIFSWTDIDFSRFTFNSNDAPQVLPFNSKVKKYKTLQLIMKNDAMNEAFGIFGIIKRYTIGTSVR